ncbi:MAG: hypothetical protein JO055_11855 [Alphaproteobacteria bacterium]|nr:hypothetical protein [Alphaproteobacteria bacterium]
MIRRAFVLSAASVSLMPSLARAADTVAGRFIAQKKTAKLAFVSAYETDKDKLVIVATEKAHAASKTPARDAEFGEFGSAVTISLAKPGGAVSQAQLAHADFPQNPITLNNVVKGVDVKFAGDRVEGRFTTNGAQSMFEGKPYAVTFDLDLQVNVQIRPKAA